MKYYVYLAVTGQKTTKTKPVRAMIKKIQIFRLQRPKIWVLHIFGQNYIE